MLHAHKAPDFPVATDFLFFTPKIWPKIYYETPFRKSLVRGYQRTSLSLFQVLNGTSWRQ